MAHIAFFAGDMCILYYGNWEVAYNPPSNLIQLPEDTIKPHEFLNPIEDYYYADSFSKNDIDWWLKDRQSYGRRK